MASKAMDLFEAYAQDKLPKDMGYIVSSFFKPDSSYSIYEVVSYSGVKAIYLTSEGLTFQTNGKKLHLLVEPPSYAHKAIEPYCRSSTEQIPKRFNEIDLVTCKNQTKIMIAKEPIQSFSAFTILKPSGINFALVFYKLPDTYETLKLFFEKTLNKEAGVPMTDAQKAAKKTIEVIDKTMGWAPHETD